MKTKKLNKKIIKGLKINNIDSKLLKEHLKKITHK